MEFNPVEYIRPILVDENGEKTDIETIIKEITKKTEGEYPIYIIGKKSRYADLIGFGVDLAVHIAKHHNTVPIIIRDKDKSIKEAIQEKIKQVNKYLNPYKIDHVNRKPTPLIYYLPTRKNPQIHYQIAEKIVELAENYNDGPIILIVNEKLTKKQIDQIREKIEGKTQQDENRSQQPEEEKTNNKSKQIIKPRILRAHISLLVLIGGLLGLFAILLVVAIGIIEILAIYEIIEKLHLTQYGIIGIGLLILSILIEVLAGAGKLLHVVHALEKIGKILGIKKTKKAKGENH